MKGLKPAIGKEISEAKMAGNVLNLTMADGSMYVLFDDGQSCCETRWATTDDDLTYFSGARLMGVAPKDAHCGKQGGLGDDHECCFVDVVTSKGVFTIVNHNEHNGYYGGFSVKFEEVGNERSSNRCSVLYRCDCGAKPNSKTRPKQGHCR